MRMPLAQRTGLTTCLVVGCLLLWARCDTIEPEETNQLVVEAFLDAEKPVPRVTLRRTGALDAPYLIGPATAAEGATVNLLLAGSSIAYRPVPGQPGQYEPILATPLDVPAQAAYALEVAWQEQVASAQGIVPRPIHIDSIQVRVPDVPVAAVLVDSLRLDTLGVDARQGFIYPIEVEMWWTLDFLEEEADSSYWIQTQLRPYEQFSSVVVDFFLRPTQILREREMGHDAANRRSWTGVYAVPVDEETDPVPPHGLTVALLRSGPDYASFATSRDAPERREPVSNVQGAVGIVAAISVDSVQVVVQ